MGSYSGSDTGKVGATRAAKDTDMISLWGEGEGCSIHDDGAGFMPVVSRLVSLRVEEEKLGFLWHIDIGRNQEC